MNEVNVSVIVPVHNTPAEPLRQCMESLINQMHVLYEIILVDDFSANRETIDLLNEYKHKYSDLITYIRLKENCGAAEARNVGLNLAKGVYCIFLDSDDFYADSLLDKLYTKCINNDADICVCGFSFYYNNEPKSGRIIGSNLTVTLADIFNKDDMLIRIPASGCNRLCKVDYLKKNNITFQSLPSDNDLFYAIMTTLCTDKIEIISDSDLIFYRFNTSYQISSKMNPLNMLTAIKKVYEKSIEKSVYSNTNNMIIVYAMETGLMEMRRCADKGICSNFYNQFRSFLNSIPHNLSASQKRMCEKKWLECDYKTAWFNEIGDYYAQMKKSDTLWDILDKKDLSIYVWGRGKRGVEFERLCSEKGVKVDGVCDRKNSDIGKIDNLGNKIVDTSYVMQQHCLLVATNSEIYSDVITRVSNEIVVVDLEAYCPL